MGGYLTSGLNCAKNLGPNYAIIHVVIRTGMRTSDPTTHNNLPSLSDTPKPHQDTPVGREVRAHALCTHVFRFNPDARTKATASEHS